MILCALTFFSHFMLIFKQLFLQKKKSVKSHSWKYKFFGLDLNVIVTTSYLDILHITQNIVYLYINMNNNIDFHFAIISQNLIEKCHRNWFISQSKRKFFVMFCSKISNYWIICENRTILMVDMVFRMK